MTSLRADLEADLQQHQQAGNWATHIAILCLLAEIANDDEEHVIAMGLYGQAWDAANVSGDLHRVAEILHRLAHIMQRVWWDSDFGQMDFDRNQIAQIFNMSLNVYIHLEDQDGQARLYDHMGLAHLYEWPQEDEFLDQAFTLYRMLGHIPQQIQILQEIIHRSPDLQRRNPLEQALVLHSHLEDEEGMARIYTDLGWLDHRLKQYSTARDAFQSALELYVRLDDHSNILSLTLRLYNLILDADGHDAAYHHYEQTYLWLRGLFTEQALMGRWLLDIANAARKRRDFRVARAGFQQALAAQAALNQPVQQAETYWTWGLMEYHDAKRLWMGFHLCQRATQIAQHYHPEKNQYQKKLGVMRRALMPSPKQKHTP